MLYPALRLDMVRCGIAIYGLGRQPQTRAGGRPARRCSSPRLRWLSRLVSVREVEAGRAIGYGCSYTTTRPSRIGVVPLGYAEGVPRAVSNRGPRACGRRAGVPIVGRVCMNATLVDVTGVPAARPGSTVTLIGSDGDGDDRRR